MAEYEGMPSDYANAVDVAPRGPVDQWIKTLTEEISMLEKAVASLGNKLTSVCADVPEKVPSEDTRAVPGGYSTLSMSLKENVLRIQEVTNMLDSFRRRIEL